MTNEYWFTPELSLPRQLEREIDRRHAARMDRNDLSVLVDKLIVDWYRQNELVDRLLGKVRQLQVEVALLAGEQAMGQRSRCKGFEEKH